MTGRVKRSYLWELNRQGVGREAGNVQQSTRMDGRYSERQGVLYQWACMYAEPGIKRVASSWKGVKGMKGVAADIWMYVSLFKLPLMSCVAILWRRADECVLLSSQARREATARVSEGTTSRCCSDGSRGPSMTCPLGSRTCTSTFTRWLWVYMSSCVCLPHLKRMITSPNEPGTPGVSRIILFLYGSIQRR